MQIRVEFVHFYSVKGHFHWHFHRGKSDILVIQQRISSFRTKYFQISQNNDETKIISKWEKNKRGCSVTREGVLKGHLSLADSIQEFFLCYIFLFFLHCKGCQLVFISSPWSFAQAIETTHTQHILYEQHSYVDRQSQFICVVLVSFFMHS